MSDTRENEIVEAMAREMCLASGFDPDAIVEWRTVGNLDVKDVQPTWKTWVDDARRQYRAHLAMMKAMEKDDG